MDTITVNGIKFAIDIEHDADMGEPWKEHDGHGEVSEWTTRDKRPGERVLCADRGSKRYYDFAGAVKTAKRDGWGPGKPHEAAEADYRRMKAWCDDEWHWCGIVVTMLDDDGERVPEHQGSLWGIESDWYEGLEEEARAIAGELMHAIEQERAVEHGYAAAGVYA